MLEEENERWHFFKRSDGVLSPNNFDDRIIYYEWRNGNVTITWPITKEQRDAILEDIKSKEKKALEEAIKKIERDGK